MNSLKNRILPSAVLLCLALAASIAVSGQSNPPPLPSGNWTFSAGAYSGPGHESALVDVYSVTADAEKGLTVTSITLNNRSSKDVTAVRLHWVLIDKDKGNILFEGNTPSVGVAIDAGKQRVLHYPVASFARIVKFQMKHSTLNGNYRLEVRVGDVTFAEESSRITKP